MLWPPWGFNYHYLTRQPILDDRTGLNTNVSFRDAELDEQVQSVLLTKPFRLDLGAVAQGFAVDLAAKELRMTEHFPIVQLNTYNDTLLT
ncbi:FAD:protein FMN transferase [Paenibacillus sp. 32352]|uniref:FAD:protein FMN transferase n=1 Tax=unclassified Paenibacillus TaxID=185978 RepID=UPI001180EB7D